MSRSHVLGIVLVTMIELGAGLLFAQVNGSIGIPAALKSTADSIEFSGSLNQPFTRLEPLWSLEVRDGVFAEENLVVTRNAFLLPDAPPFPLKTILLASRHLEIRHDGHSPTVEAYYREYFVLGIGRRGTITSLCGPFRQGTIVGGFDAPVDVVGLPEYAGRVKDEQIRVVRPPSEGRESVRFYRSPDGSVGVLGTDSATFLIQRSGTTIASHPFSIDAVMFSDRIRRMVLLGKRLGQPEPNLVALAYDGRVEFEIPATGSRFSDLILSPDGDTVLVDAGTLAEPRRRYAVSLTSGVVTEVNPLPDTKRRWTSADGRYLLMSPSVHELQYFDHSSPENPILLWGRTEPTVILDGAVNSDGSLVAYHRLREGSRRVADLYVLTGQGAPVAHFPQRDGATRIEGVEFVGPRVLVEGAQKHAPLALSETAAVNIHEISARH